MSQKSKDKIKKNWMQLAIGGLGVLSAGTLGFEINQAIEANNKKRDIERLERTDMGTSKEIIVLETKISKLENQVENLQRQLTSLETSLETSNKERNGNKSSIDQILNAITSIKNDIVDMKGDIKILQLGK